MKKVLVSVLGLAVVVPIGLYAYGYKQGQQMGENGAPALATGLVVLSMNPVSQVGFRAGYKEGIVKKQELEEWSKDYFGPWVGWSSTDKITDFENYYLVNEGDIGPYSENATLTMRCLNNKTEVYVKWGSYIIGDRNDRLNVTHRIDSAKAINKAWNLSTDKKAFFYDGKDIEFIKSMIGAKKLVVQFTDQTTKTVSFDLDRLDEEVRPLAKACSWEAKL
ncbi:hypothetical protein QNE79_000771 [Vibrio alginolyticus]|nr:hypothetical protein [Vibrio alginolyticus]